MGTMSTSAKILVSALACLALIMLAVLAMPEWRMQVRSALLPESKTLLARVEGDLWGTGESFEVLKFQQGRGLAVEVRQLNSPDVPQLVDRMVIPDRFNSHFDLLGRSTQLAILDVDGDGELEIIAPSVDDRLNTHLNVLRLSKTLKRLEIVRGHSL